MPEEQRFIFDEVAEIYDRVRPRYPEVLIDDVIYLSRIAPYGRILEVGCGTGQATLPFARRGFVIDGLEPGSALARLAQARLTRFPKAEVIQCTFEAWPLEAKAYDLIISAQSFHWITPEIRFAKSAAALRTGGALAVFGNAVVYEATPLREAIDDAYAHHAPSLGGPPTTHWYAREGPIPLLFDDSHCFGSVIWRAYPWSQAYTSTEYLDLLRTHSDHRLLPTEQREKLLDAVHEAIEIHGGNIECRYVAHLYLARRAD